MINIKMHIVNKGKDLIVKDITKVEQVFENVGTHIYEQHYHMVKKRYYNTSVTIYQFGKLIYITTFIFSEKNCVLFANYEKTDYNQRLCGFIKFLQNNLTDEEKIILETNIQRLLIKNL